MENFAGLVAADSAVNNRLGQISKDSLAESASEDVSVENELGYISPVRNVKDQEQEDRDRDQDLKDKELYEALQCERETLAALYSELEKERNFSATAASEALAMISRLQEEKAAVQLEARQFQRMVLEKAMYDQEAIEALNELLMSREEEKLALEEEIRVCRERLDSVMKEERRQSLKPNAISESPILNRTGKVIVTPRAVKEEQPKCIDKFSTTKSQLYAALIPDAGRGIEAEFEKAQIGVRPKVAGRENGSRIPPANLKSKVGKSDEGEDGKHELTGYVSLKRRWGAQEVSLKTLDQTKEERRIEEKRLSVLEFVRKFEQQQQGARLPVLQSSTKHRSGGDSRSKAHSDDVEEGTDSLSSSKNETPSRVLTRDHSMRRRLFQEDQGDEERVFNVSPEDAEDGGIYDRRRSCVGTNEVVDDEMCKGIDDTEQCSEETLFVHDVYEVQKLGPGTEDADYVRNFSSAEPHPTTPSDRLGKPDLHSFDRGDRDYESEPEPLCFIHPAHLDEDVDDLDKDSPWEDLQGKVRYKNLRVSSSLRGDDTSSGVEEEIENLTNRLKTLEADKYFMKQVIESLKRENGEMKLAQQLREFGRMEQQELWPKRLPMTFQFQGMMSFARLCNNAQARLNKLAFTCLRDSDTTGSERERSVGLSRLLQQSPKGLPGTCLTRVRKAEEIIPTTILSRKIDKWPFSRTLNLIQR
ncbi:uncharacterized protein [Physcomitrium patens]|uniref:GTD-binding domain-containing protein n=1 Tax=Physcomitrium patens TaxID=3218 RepID=A0A2K1J959_PHYPA|nr:uncharacterized protein LOC112293785 isoform X1 [Physcomitrium patens]XP_024399390.1 uncharacterized protein LOC112293785 isoform X1 [Physcomitrium patens]XP_024399391.1 uncharacterized protein LOC112293785 isoform X1 [Physcomitrium patens]PNR38064.1 hypothetical protein PHYPA_021175 [Physcomitrium patens]|eukprot:XP_024399389.1 uncharacterized protein LOC112293785 isoform X1 [Physcomitrella patens]